MPSRLPLVRPLALGGALLLALTALPVAARLTLMHGYADVTSALLWIQADAPGPIEVAWTPEGDATPRRATFEAAAANENVVVARLTGLTPGRRAAYRVAGDGDVREGTVRAQPHWSRVSEAPDLAIALGSCFFLADANPLVSRPGYGGGFEIFAAIAAQKPDVMLWLGDNLYFQAPDFLDPAALSARHRRQRAFEPLQPLLTAAPHLAIWDDHDYGPNDGDRSYALKGETLNLFRRYWANPSWGLARDTGRVRLRAIRRRRPVPARRSVLPRAEPRARQPGQDDVRTGPAGVAEGRADAVARAGQDRRRWQPVLEPDQPLRGLAPVSDRAEGLRRVARRASGSTA